jgi:hypothetical protein
VNFKAISISFLISLVGVPALALLSTSTLPEGINSPSIRYGIVSNIGEKYTENGTLMNLGELKSVVFDSKTLKNFDSDAQKLVDALNSFGQHQLGDRFEMGILRIRTAPEVKYTAPVYARGMTKKWTLGVGLPIVSYRNVITLSHENSNLAYYRQQYSGLSTELDQALRTDLVQETHQTLQQKGYKPLANRDESFLGDVQAVSIYKFFENAQSALIYQAQLSLPTGPQYDSDDLSALNIFGRTSLNSTLAYSHRLASRWTVLPFASYLFNLRDQVTARVPQSADDTLPGEESKESVSREIGNTAAVGSNLFYEFTDSWQIGAGYDYSMKASDKYAGSRNARYDLIAVNSDSQAHRMKVEVTYSSIKSYFRKTALIPLMFTLEVSDVVAGMNIERQMVQEFNFMMFF